MTSIVGVLCRDGVVIGADSSATFGAPGNLRTIEQPAEKLEVVADRLIIAGTGAVGLGQRFASVVERLHTQGQLNAAAIEVGRRLAAGAIQDFQGTGLQRFDYGALVAFSCNGHAHLCEMETGTFQPELKVHPNAWYASMGSAQLITDPFLGFIRSVFWGQGALPTLQAGMFATAWTLQQAVELNTGGVKDPIRIAVLEQDGAGGFRARKLSEPEVGQHLESVRAAKDHLATFAGILNQNPNAPDLPAPPPA